MEKVYLIVPMDKKTKQLKSALFEVYKTKELAQKAVNKYNYKDYNFIIVKVNMYNSKDFV